ncbi:filament-like plant protein 7 [Forsythia ovata]|uniref:Filament-like plant protein 7 n=1 Tax=Forsythia ovata TaxID=205694 RepID=A0ABD1WZU4_9LAMI
MASRLTQVEEQHEESSKGQTTVELGKHLHFVRELSLASMSDLGSDDKASYHESWASALTSELEHLKNEQQMGTPSHRTVETADTNLMDDFAEMEKLAVVSVDYPAGSSHHSPPQPNLFAGKDSTSTTLTWFFWLIAGHSRCEHLIYEELFAASLEERPGRLVC